METNKTFRNNGAIGALLDEYEKAIEELKIIIHDVSIDNLTKIVDNKTKDEDCRSIQSILSHVVGAGYNYVIAIRKWQGESIVYKEKKRLLTIENYKTALDKMFAYNVTLFDDYPNLPLEEQDSNKKIKVSWGQRYDVEQLLEHAIVHILRHRRQIERFKLKMKGEEYCLNM